MVGKRKREYSVVNRDDATASSGSGQAAPSNAAQDVFRRYFEARFEPIEQPGQSPPTQELASDSSETGSSDAESEWDGLSGEDESDAGVEVVDYARADRADGPVDKKIRQAFMNSKPPSLSDRPSQPTRLAKGSTDADADADDDDDDDDKKLDARNLKNDLALQRLLRESHLLESSSAELAPSGKNRHRAIDLRLQALGAKTSIYKQDKMPDSHRRGINAKAVVREAKRRREARENGIILEKPSPAPKPGQRAGSSKRRDRGIGAPAVGRFARGTLTLSQRDLARVQGRRRKTKGRPKGRSR